MEGGIRVALDSFILSQARNISLINFWSYVEMHKKNIRDVSLKLKHTGKFPNSDSNIKGHVSQIHSYDDDK